MTKYEQFQDLKLIIKINKQTMMKDIEQIEKQLTCFDFEVVSEYVRVNFGDIVRNEFEAAKVISNSIEIING